jgi:hypothetical protein
VQPMPITMLWPGEELPPSGVPPEDVPVEKADKTRAKRGQGKSTNKSKAPATQAVGTPDSPAMGTRSKRPIPTSPGSPAMGTRSKRKLNIS